MYAPLFRNVLYPLYETRLRERATLRRLAELERTQWLPESEQRERSWRLMLETLAFAEARVPFYRRRFAEYGVAARQVHSPDDLLRFPILTKDDIRKHGDELRVEGFQGQLFQSGSSGSTGEPIRFFHDHATYENRIAAAMRSDRWAGADLGEKEMHLWGIPLVTEKPWKKAKRKAFEAVMRRRFVNTFDLSERRLAEVIQEIVAYEPKIVIAYVTPLYHVARYALAHGHVLPRPRGIVATAEKVFDHQREVIERAFGASVFDRYGCREVMLIASECERHEGKHLNMENVFVELHRGDRLAQAGEAGEVVVTELANRATPMIRYKNGDVATRATKPCSCGRGLPMLSSVDGRVLDMIVGPEGQLLAGEFFPHLLKDVPHLDRFQVHQDRTRAITVKLLPGEGFSPGVPAMVEHKLKSFLGQHAAVRVEVVSEMPLTRGGKHRHTISEVPVDVGSVGA